MTLAELLAFDFEALWKGLTAEQQARIGVLALTNEFATSVGEDDGLDASDKDRDVACNMAQDAINTQAIAIQSFFPAVEFNRNELCEASRRNIEMAHVEPGMVRIKDRPGLAEVHGGLHDLNKTVHLDGRDVLIGGVEPVGTDEAPAYVCWTLDQIEAERLRRHRERVRP